MTLYVWILWMQMCVSATQCDWYPYDIIWMNSGECEEVRNLNIFTTMKTVCLRSRVEVELPKN